jgi:hypothetical protein
VEGPGVDPQQNKIEITLQKLKIADNAGVSKAGRDLELI